MSFENVFEAFKIYASKRHKKQCFGDSFDYFIFGGKKPLSPTSVSINEMKITSKFNVVTITINNFETKQYFLYQNHFYIERVI